MKGIKKFCSDREYRELIYDYVTIACRVTSIACEITKMILKHKIKRNLNLN